MNRIVICLLLLGFGAYSNGEELFGFVQGERVEHCFEPDAFLWDLQGRYGGDYHRFWWKTEGAVEGDSTDEAEVQLLYSRAWTAFFDLQAGVRLQDIDNIQVTSLALGLQGLSPYRFETDAALFVSEDGDVTLRAEFERDIPFRQNLVVQPRAEINVALQDSPELGIGRGLNDVGIGIRARYEFTRKFAPYLGLEYETAFGSTADRIEAAGGDRSETTLVAGLRFWF